VVRLRPGRVRAIYVRHVSTPARADEVTEIGRSLRGDGVEMVLVEDSVQAAEHALAAGLVRAEAVASVRHAVALERGAPELLG